MNPEIRPTTQDDVERFFGKPMPYRARAVTAVVGEKIIGIGGVAMLPDGSALAFLDMADGAERYAVTLHKTALRVIADAKRRGIRKIAACADLTKPAAVRWLIRLGFHPVQIDGETVYIWQN